MAMFVAEASKSSYLGDAKLDLEMRPRRPRQKREFFEV